MSDFTVFDIETNGRAPWSADLLVAGIGDTAHIGSAAKRAMVQLFKRPGVIVEHTMYDARWALMSGATLGAQTEIHDLRTMAWMDAEEVSGDPQPFKLEKLMKRYLGETILKPIARSDGVVVWDCDIIPVPGRKGRIPIDDVPLSLVQEYNLQDLDEEGRLYEHLRDRLDDDGLWDVYLDKEVELGIVLVTMEATGLPFDSKTCDKLRDLVRTEADELRAMLVDTAGIPGLNIGSTQQMSRLLFTPKGQRVEVKGRIPLTDEQRAALKGVAKEDKLARVRKWMPKTFEAQGVGTAFVTGVWVGKGRGLHVAEHGFGSSTHWKQKAAEHKNPSTSSVSLVLMNPTDEFVSDLVYWRELDKLEGSFLAKFPTYVHDGRLHGTVNRTGTVTGRFSSSEPNLQNIPAHGTYGALVRSLFTGKLALGDYAQLEQRIAAHFSQDPALLRAYQENIDLYGLAASTLFGGEADKKHVKRGLMKTGMLSLQYGAGSGKLAQLMMIDGHKMDDGSDPTPEDALVLIDQLKSVFPDFFAWRDDVIYQAIRDGYIRTLSGRYRRLEFPERWESRRRRARQWYSEEERAKGFMMERQAINAKCQGGAADVVSGAMVAVALEMPDALRVLVQVHDELVWERLAGWRGKTSLAKLRDLCENGHGYELAVPLVFEAQEAKSWAEKGGGATNANSLFRERANRDRAARDNKSEGLQSRKASQFGDADARAARIAAAREKAKTAEVAGNAGRGRTRRTS